MKSNEAPSYPLTQEQLGIYLDCEGDPISLRYNCPITCRLPEGINVQRFAEAVRTVVQHHPIMYSRVASPQGVPSLIPISCEPEIGETQVERIEAATGAFCRPFDLKTGPLCHFEIAHSPEGDAFLLDIHHLVFDGSSIVVFLSNLASVYDGGECPDEDLTLAECCLAQAEIDPAHEQETLEMLDQCLAGFSWESKPVPDQVVANPADVTGEASLEFGDARTIEQFSTFASEHKVSENALFLGAFGYTLAKFNGAAESTFTTVHHGRTDKRLANTMGMFVRTLPMTCRFDESLPPEAMLRDMYERFYRLKKNDCIPFADIAARYGATTDISFVYQAQLLNDIPFGGGTMGVEPRLRDTVSPLEFMLMKHDDGFEPMVRWHAAEYTESFVRNLMDAYVQVLHGMTSVPTLKDIELADEASRARIEAFNQTEKDYGADKTVVDLFRERAAATPDALCLVYADKRFTYREVDEITDHVARRLVSGGFRVGDVAGILIPRSEYMLTCSLGVLKAGGAYLPLDPSYPAERLNLMMQDSGAAALIATPDLVGVIADDFTGPRLMAGDISVVPDAAETEPPLPTPTPDDLFIMLYTSGSTGTPKGVPFKHGNAMVAAASARTLYGIEADSHVAAYASFGFDANVLDTYATLGAGAQLHIVPDEIRLDLLALQRAFKEAGITHVLMTTQVGRQFALAGGSEGLQRLFMAGEKLTPFDPTELGFEVFNLYGPTEGSVMATGFKIDKLYRDVPIGRGIDNIKLYVVEPEGRLLPCGAVGELWLAGPQVTPGYHNLPEKTATAFVANPFSDDARYLRAYRTGDIVRQLGDGTFQFIGRRDKQVKIRGFRVELTEVEEVIRRFPGIEDATVATFDDEAGTPYIAAYVVSDAQVDVAALNAFIAEEKPSYMVPAVTMQIDAIPLTQNQKVDRRALPKPVRTVQDATPPETETQQRIFDVLARVLEHDAFGVDTNVFDAGLTSIGMLKLGVELGREFDMPVSIADLREHDTVRKLEAFTQSAAGQPGDMQKPPTRLDDYPLTQSQHGVFVECSANPGTVLYNIPLLIEADKKVDAGRLQAAVSAAIDAHPFLKTTLFSDEGGDIRARRNDEAPAVVERVACDALPDSSELVRPFELLGQPLYRAAVYEAQGKAFLFLDFHHIISDGTTASILLEDISAAYAGQTLEPEPFSGFDVALEEQAARASERFEKAKAYYEGLLSGLEASCLPPEAPEGDAEGAASAFRTCRAKASAVQAFCEGAGLTMNAYLLSAFGYALSRFTQYDDVSFATVYSGRGDSRLARTASMLVKTLPVVVRGSENKPVVDAIRATQTQLMDSMSHDVFSFAEATSSFGASADVLFVYQSDAFNFDELCGLPARFVDIVPTVAKEPISIMVGLRGDALEVQADYRTDMFNEALIGSLLDAFDCAIDAFAASEELKDVSLLSEAGAAQVAKANDTMRPYDNVPVNVLFERHAAAQPDRLAVIADDQRLTYGQLNGLANRLAHALISLGVTQDTIVGMMLERTSHLPIAEIGILKSGGAFLGLPPDFPDDRVEFCLLDAESPIVVTTSDIIAQKPQLFAEDKPYRAIAIDELIAHADDSNPDIAIAPESLAYCIYTSGSTGRPKGAMLTHRNLACFAQPADHANALSFGNGGGEVSLAFSSISFDMSLLDNLVFLLNGKSVCIATEEQRHNPASLAKLVAENGIDVITATPSLFSTYIDFPEFRDILARAKTIVAGGEAFAPKLYAELRRIAPNAHIVNVYGPTECTIVCCSQEVLDERDVTLGKPTPNMALFAVDRFLNTLPPYGCGELMICGDMVGRGYIKLPEKTAAAYMTFKDMPAFRSGDTVRINAKGEFESFGRIDNQVKLRGYRIELGEIEACMCAFEGVKSAKVVVRNNGSEDYLAGFFTAQREIDVDELSDHLKKTLTYYMVPDVLMQLESMPLNPSGKIDKKALPEIQQQARKTGRKAPKKSLEQRICDLFRDVLSIDECYADDNFFELGGTSLSASKVVMQLMAQDVKIEYQDIFDNPTPELLAAHLESLRQQARPATPAAAEGQGESPIVFEQPPRFTELLKANSIENAANVKREPLGDVLLTGATGFLGVHVLKELIDAREGNITCLVRASDDLEPEQRLKNVLMYYFESPFIEEFGERIKVLNLDITDSELSDKLADVRFDTLINCAASVKHYEAGDELQRTNVGGVGNLIACTKAKGARLVQVSTISVAGMHTNESYDRQTRLQENRLFIIDSTDNKYVLSKYDAEVSIFEAIESGLRGKVIRVGNLMGRHSDGEFQINANSNAFLNAIRGFATIGKSPLSHTTDPISFSPVDLTAKAVVLLAGTNDEFTAFNANSRYEFDEMQIIQACTRCGISIVPVGDEEYYADYQRMLADDTKNARLQGLVTNDRPDLHAVNANNTFTTNVLYRLGFTWPLVDNAYLDRAIDALASLDYFE